MNDQEREPTRLFDEGSNAPLSLRAALLSASGESPSQADLDALAAALGPSLGPIPSAPTLHGPRTWLALKLGALVTSGVAVAAVAGHVISVPGTTAASTPMSGVTLTLPEPATVVAAETATALAIAPNATASSARAPAPAVAARMTSTNETGPSEVEFLAHARRVLDSDPKEALALCRKHQQRFPNGSLAQEREVIRIEALNRLGRAGDAASQADQFHAHYPSSMHERDVGTPPSTH